MIEVTENALNKIKALQQESGNLGAGLRVGVVGGGCSGLSYKLDFQNEPSPDDKVLEKDGVRIFVDPKSSVLINGMVLDHSGGLNGTGFGFKNPNATKSCGCGTSFAV